MNIFFEYGCDVRFYGENCTKCQDSCLNDTCQVQNGHCFYCKDGFNGRMCEELLVSIMLIFTIHLHALSALIFSKA